MLFVSIVVGMYLTAVACVIQAIRVEKKWDDEDDTIED
jgi:hypothetical protein